MSDYEVLTMDVLSHAQGHPLAIEVIGKSLFGRNVSQWRSTLARLRDNKSMDIMNVLRISYDDLEQKDKEIFLDIACFFAERSMQHVKEILDFRGFDPEIGLQVLVDKSLIFISDGLICMHDLLRDLGKFIVRKDSEEQRKWSRLWDYEDLDKVMSGNMEAENLEVIVVEYIPLRFRETTMRVDVLSKMKNLKFLGLRCDGNFSGNLNYLSNELGYLTWTKYPFNFLPQCFQPHKLIELNLIESNIKQLWKGSKPLPNLRLVNVLFCENLIEVGNFGEAPNLESLNLVSCIQLRQLHSSVGLLRKLTILNLKHCRSLTDLPHFVEDLNLKELNLEGCVKLRQIHPSIGHLRKLTVLNLTNCKSLVSLPNTILGLSSLEYLSLFGCSNLYNIYYLSEEQRDARHLKKLRMGEAASCSQSRFSFLKKWLSWPFVAFDKSFEDAHKDSVGCLLPSLPIFSCMRQLDLSFCNLLKIPDAFGSLHRLEKLCLRGNNFETLPSLKDLSKLSHLNLQHCKRLKYLPELPSQTDDDLPELEWSITRVEFNEMVLGLNIFNCPELVERCCCTRICLSWMMQMVQAFSKHEWLLRFTSISSIIPGSEIPRWFDKQHVGMGNVINIEDASHFMEHDNNCIGLACSVIFVLHKERIMRPPEWEPRPFIFSIPLLFLEDLVTDELEHTWLFYFTRTEFIFLFERETNIELTLECYSRGGDECCDVEVKKYAYHWVHKQDLELSNLTMNSENPLPRKCKFLAIEENK